MSEIYENWERLVDAVLDREIYRQLCRDNSSVYSVRTSSDFSSNLTSPLRDLCDVIPPDTAAGSSSSPTLPPTVVIVGDIQDQKQKNKIMKIVSSFPGVESIHVEMMNLTVIGDFAPIPLIQKIKKSHYAELMSIGPVRRDPSTSCNDAYASLVSLMQLIHHIERHPTPPISLDNINNLLDSITQRIAFFQEFLYSYSSNVAGDGVEAADPLEMRIAAAAYAATDAIETSIYKMANDEKIKSLNKCFGILQSMIEEMDSIKKAVPPVDTQKKKKPPPPVVVVHDQVAITDVVTVSTDRDLQQIMENLVGDELDCQVIPIMGIGGIGKTFLAKTVYAEPLIKDHFDIRAWATISLNYNTGEILCELLSQATNTKKEKPSGKSVDELGWELHKYLFSRRFLIVMDDMWGIDAWDKIQRFFPNNGNGSRVLVTTRQLQLGFQFNNFRLYVSFLDWSGSWDLLSKTVFGDKSRCPPELEEIGMKIMAKCRGLPLSIAVMAGLLKKMDSTRESWKLVQDNFNSVMYMSILRSRLRVPGNDQGLLRALSVFCLC